jgi:DDE superfamily endonuclease
VVLPRSSSVAGRKHKFGLNMQAKCDADGKFVNISIAHPASTSDFLAFSTSKLQKKIESPGFLAPGLCIFGDNAYVNNSYFMTPFKNIRVGSKDAFNFYHSQLMINILSVLSACLLAVGEYCGRPCQRPWV